MKDEEFIYPSGKHYDAMLTHSPRDILDDVNYYINKRKSIIVEMF